MRSENAASLVGCGVETSPDRFRGPDSRGPRLVREDRLLWHRRVSLERWGRRRHSLRGLLTARKAWLPRVELLSLS
jgi:hypothetical protein